MSENNQAPGTFIEPEPGEAILRSLRNHSKDKHHVCERGACNGQPATGVVHALYFTDPDWNYGIRHLYFCTNHIGKYPQTHWCDCPVPGDFESRVYTDPSADFDEMLRRLIPTTCVAMVCEGLYILPSGNSIILASNIDVVDAKTVFEEDKAEPQEGEMLFIKNKGYATCGSPGVVWDKHADNRDDRPGWLCAWHSGTGDTRHQVMLADCEKHATLVKKDSEEPVSEP